MPDVRSLPAAQPPTRAETPPLETTASAAPSRPATPAEVRRLERALAEVPPEQLIGALSRASSDGPTRVRELLRRASAVEVPSAYTPEQVAWLARFAPSTRFHVTYDDPPSAALRLPENVAARLRFGARSAPTDGTDEVEFPREVGEGVRAIEVYARSLFRSPQRFSLASTLAEVELRLDAGRGMAVDTRNFFPALAQCRLERLVLEGDFFLPDLLAFTPPPTLRHLTLVTSTPVDRPPTPPALVRGVAESHLLELETNVPELLPFPTSLDRLTLSGPRWYPLDLAPVSDRWQKLPNLRSLTLDRLPMFASPGLRLPFPPRLASLSLSAPALDVDTLRTWQRAVVSLGAEALHLDVPQRELLVAAACFAPVPSLSLALRWESEPLPTRILSRRLELDLRRLLRSDWPAPAMLLARGPRLVELDLSSPTAPQTRGEQIVDRASLHLGPHASRLEALELGHRAVSREMLEAWLPALPNLRRLGLRGTELEGDLASLPWSAVPRLESLDISKTRVSGALSELIAAMPAGLAHLDARETELDARGALPSGRDVDVWSGGAPPPRVPRLVTHLRTGFRALHLDPRRE